MKRTENAVIFYIGIFLALLAGYIFLGGGLFQGYLAPDTPEGFQSLGAALEAGHQETLKSAGFADTLGKILELAVAFISWSIGMAIAILTPIVRWISATLYSYTHGEQTPQPQPVNSGEVEVSAAPPQAFGSMIPLLLKAVESRDKHRTVQFCHLLAGDDYLYRSSKKVQTLDSNGFPAQKEV